MNDENDGRGRRTVTGILFVGLAMVIAAVIVQEHQIEAAAEQRAALASAVVQERSNEARLAEQTTEVLDLMTNKVDLADLDAALEAQLYFDAETTQQLKELRDVVSEQQPQKGVAY